MSHQICEFRGISSAHRSEIVALDVQHDDIWYFHICRLHMLSNLSALEPLLSYPQRSHKLQVQFLLHW